jgi:YHS domain-containing protein
MKARLVVLSAAALLVCATVYAADAAKVKLDGVKCPVSGKDVKEASAVDYKGGKVYFCCDGCPNAFKKDTAKYATKANMQLVATGQYKEVKCPVAGKDLNPATAIEVGGVKVCFCCNGCKGKVTKAEGDAQLELVFGEEAFKKGFAAKKAE